MKTAPKPRGNPAWKKGGKSPNPGGRPPLPAEVRDMARAHTTEAFETVFRLMKSGEPDSVKLRAAEVVLDRAWGKPEQSVEMSGNSTGLSEFALHVLSRLAGEDDAAKKEDSDDDSAGGGFSDSNRPTRDTAG